MPSNPVEPDDIPKSDIPRDMLLDLAAEFGIRADVADLLRDAEAKGNFGLRNMTLVRVLQIARTGRSRLAVSKACDTAPSIITAYEDGVSKNMRLNTTLKLKKGYRVPFLILICAALRQYGFLPAPGAKPIPRNRTRMRNDK